MNFTSKPAFSRIFIVGICLYLSTPLVIAQETSAQALVDIVHRARVIDARIPLEIEIVNHQAIAALSVKRTTSTFELDSKNAAFDISRAIMDADPDITSVLVQFKSASSSEYNEVLVGGGEVSSYNSGRVSREQILNSLELNTMILVVQPGAKGTGADIKPESARFADAGSKLKASEGNSFALLPTDTSGGITDEIPIPAVGSDPYFERAVKENSKPVHLPRRPRDKYFCMGRVAFFYPPAWTRRAVSKNFWATPDEVDLAEFACRSKGGNPFLSLSKFEHISEEARLENEAMVGAAFGLEVTTPETIKIGYGGVVVAKSILSTGRDGLIYFKRVYFKDGFDLYALTLKCKASEAAALEPDLAHILSTIHAPRPDALDRSSNSRERVDKAHGRGSDGRGSDSRKRPGKDNQNSKDGNKPGGLKLQPDPNAPERPVNPEAPKTPDGLKNVQPPKDAELRARPTA
jgi:hypothetical protein